MRRKPKVALSTMEAGLRCLWGEYQQANYRGGLGLLIYDFIGGLNRVFRDAEIRVFVPLYSRLWFHRNTFLDYRNILGDPNFTLRIQLRRDNGTWTVNGWHKVIDGQSVTLLELPDKDNLSFLYTEDRLARLRQQIIFARAVMKIMEQEQFLPDVLWLNECASGLLAPMICSNPAFPKPKILYTNHTALNSARELYREYRWDEIGIDDCYREMFIEQNVLDLMRGLMELADVVNGVSSEHEGVLKQLFPQWASKITHVTNGVLPPYWRHPELHERVLSGHNLSGQELSEIHDRARGQFFDMIQSRTGKRFSAMRFTVGWNRRFQAYKNNKWPRLYLPAILAPYGEKVKTELGELEGLGGQFVAAGMAPETDREMLDEIRLYKNACDPESYAAFIEESSVPLMEHFARGLDLHLSMPRLLEEAAGTSPDRCAQNGIPTVANWTGSIPEWMNHFEWEFGTGNSFIVKPHLTTPLEQYYQVRYYAMLWHQKSLGDIRAQRALEALAKNVFETGKSRDVAITLEGYKKIIHRLCAMFSTV